MAAGTPGLGSMQPSARDEAQNPCKDFGQSFAKLWSKLLQKVWHATGAKFRRFSGFRKEFLATGLYGCATAL